MGDRLKPIYRPSVLELAALPNAVSSARRHTRDMLPRWGYALLIDVCELLVSELVTNAVKASGFIDQKPSYPELHDRLELVKLCLFPTKDSIFIEVWDSSTEKPTLNTPDDSAENGRGMLLVESLSERWNVYYPKRGGKIVWCEVSNA